MYKVIATWSGFPGAPGVSNFYFAPTVSAVAADVLAAAGRVRAFFAGITLCLPTPVSIQVQADAQIIDPATGAVTGSIVAGPAPAVVAGAGGAFYSAVSGACVVWRTGVTVGRNVVKGKTFVVPLTAAAYDGDGTLLASRLAELRAMGLALGVSGAFPPAQSLCVWHRPTGGAGGQAILSTGATVNDRVAFLKSRRA